MMDNTIGAHDVLCGRGGATNNNSGNIRFREIVASRQAEYLTAKKKEKTAIAVEVVETVRSNGGRFLLRNEANGCWVEVVHKKAVTKASQALREGLDVKNKRVRDSKLAGQFTDEQRKKRQKVVTGKVAATGSPALVSLAGNDGAIPELNEEEEPAAAAAAVFDQQKPVKTEDCDELAEV
jgi:hypothetical protein